MLAGTAKIDITCREQGAASYRASQKTLAHIPKELWDKKIVIDDPLYLKALVLEDGAHRLAFITMDVTAIGSRSISQDILNDSADDFMPRLRQALKREAGIDPDHVTVCASHTHPPGRLLCDDNQQIDKAVQAVRQAVARLTPAKVGAGSVQESRLTFNRTLKMKDGTDYTVRGCNPYPPDEDIEALRPNDPEVGVLRIDRLDGTPLALVYNFASHLLIGTPDSNITADFPGVTSSVLESTLGSDVMAFFVQGAGGDLSEISQLDRDQPRWGPQFGLVLAQAVLAAHRSIVPVETDLATATEHVRFPLRTDIPDVVSQLRAEQAELTASLRYTNLNFKMFLPLFLKYQLSDAYPLQHAYRYLQDTQTGVNGYPALDRRNRQAIAKYLQSLKAMERMARNEEKIATLLRHAEIIASIGTPEVAAEIQALRIGNCLWLTAPMEVTAEIGLDAKRASPFAHTFLASNTNGYLHYAAPAAYYPRGGYEVTECLLAPQWQPLFERTVSSLFQRLR